MCCNTTLALGIFKGEQYELYPCGVSSLPPVSSSLQIFHAAVMSPQEQYASNALVQGIVLHAAYIMLCDCL